MSNVEFNVDQPQFTSRAILGNQRVPGMTAWLMKKGIIKEESQAGGILIGIVLFNIIVTGVLVYFYIL